MNLTRRSFVAIDPVRAADTDYTGFVAALAAQAFQNTMPPATSIVLPVTHAASADTANDTAAAMSRG